MFTEAKDGKFNKGKIRVLNEMGFKRLQWTSNKGQQELEISKITNIIVGEENGEKL